MSSRTYSTGPVRIGSPVGKYTFGPATGGPQGQINFGAKPASSATIPAALASRTPMTPARPPAKAKKPTLRKK